MDSFSLLVKKGIIPINWIDYKVIYEYYLKELEKFDIKGKVSSKNKRQAKENTAEEYNISERTVYLIISKMKG